jgi:hypothetical protein
MSGNPTSSSHMRVALVSTGLRRLGWRRNRRFSEPPSRAGWTRYSTTPVRPRSNPKRPLTERASSAP